MSERSTSELRPALFVMGVSLEYLVQEAVEIGPLERNLLLHGGTFVTLVVLCSCIKFDAIDVTNVILRCTIILPIFFSR